MTTCTDAFESKVDGAIGSFFSKLGLYVGKNPKKTIVLSFLLMAICGIGFLRWETENREAKLWVPQGTTAQAETEMYESYFSTSSRFNTAIVQTNQDGGNVLTKESLVEAMQLHKEIATSVATIDGAEYTLVDLCTKAGGACVSSTEGVCQCLITSILKQWNYDLEILQVDENILDTLNAYGSREDLEAVLGGAVFDDSNVLVSAEAMVLSYFLEERMEVVDGTEQDPINEGWEGQVFLKAMSSVEEDYETLAVDYFAARSFSDEFGDEITSDLSLVQVSYIVAFLFLGANMGKIKCGPGSRWTMALAALITVGLSTGAGFGASSGFGLFFGPVHNLLPFILLGIGVDDAFVIVNAFNRERKVARSAESNEDLATRSARSLARAGTSITVTSATDLVAFAISSASALPALSSFCAYAAVAIFFLWFFSATFFTACLVLDERRQRDNRRECLVCCTRKNPMEDDEGDVFEEDLVSRYFRNYHAPAILSRAGKVIVLLFFSGLIAFGVYGAMNLSVEDSTRSFIPEGSYLQDYFAASDEFFPSKGIDLYFVFERGSDIYASRTELADLESRLSGLSEMPPYIAEPVSEEAYRNVVSGLSDYLTEFGSGAIGNVTLGDDGWPLTQADFLAVLKEYAAFDGPGAMYAQDIALTEDGTSPEAIRVKSQYVQLTKVSRGKVMQDADRQIEAMDATRELVASWDDLPSAYPYSDQFITIEGFKIIQRELFLNVGLAILAVGFIVTLTVANVITSLLITINVAFCIIEILGFMYALGIVIDSVSVINIVLAVGLSVDYSAHVGHCFMVKGGSDKNNRVVEALADIGAAVMSGALSTFLAVAVLLFSSSYVFEILSKQFAITVGLGVIHGLILLPVALSLIGPRPFASAEAPPEAASSEEEKISTRPKNIGITRHEESGGDDSD